MDDDVSGCAGLRAHCDRLINMYESAQKEYEQLAAEHKKWRNYDTHRKDNQLRGN